MDGFVLTVGSLHVRGVSVAEVIAHKFSIYHECIWNSFKLEFLYFLSFLMLA